MNALGQFGCAFRYDTNMTAEYNSTVHEFLNEKISSGICPHHLIMNSTMHQYLKKMPINGTQYHKEFDQIKILSSILQKMIPVINQPPWEGDLIERETLSCI